MEKISVGRVVIYRPPTADGKGGPSEYPAIVTFVHSPDLVNLVFFGGVNPAEARTSVIHRVEDVVALPGWRWPTRT